MSVKLRFRRMGRKKLPIYSLVAADSRSPRDGRFIEDLGRYEPLEETAVVRFNEDRILYWLRQGAQPSHTVRNLLSEQGVMLRLHMLRKGKTEEEIEQAVIEFLAHRAENKPVKKSKAELRAERMQAERATAAEKAEEMAKKRAEREAELEKQRQAAEDAERAARAERTEASADLAGLDVAPEIAAETEVAPATEAAAEPTAEDAPSVDEAAPEAVAEEATDEKAPVVDESAQETIAEAAPIDPEPISEPEAEAAEMIEEGAPVVAEEAEEPVAEEPVTEEPVAEEPVAEEPVAEEPVVEEPVVEEAPLEKPVAEEKGAVDASTEPDKLTKVLGIGPKFSSLLNEHGITTFAQLASIELESLRTIVNESGISASSTSEESWAKQAEFLAADDKEGLKAYIQELKSAR